LYQNETQVKLSFQKNWGRHMTNNEKTIRVWDPIVRLGHWTLVIAFFTAYFTEDDFLTQHVYAGYVVGVVVCVRLLWGFAGTKYARFSDFVRSPAVTRQYLADLMTNRAKRFLGHNPAGGAMIVALLLGISGTVISGLMLYAIEEGEGPLAAWVADASVPSGAPTLISRAFADDDDDDDDDYGERDAGDEHDDEAAEEFWEEIHEFFANLTLLLVGLHVAGVLFSSYAHKENLIKAMITGRKRSGET
jgi:cytochrome b